LSPSARSLDHKLHAYYHWVERNIDFNSLDNTSIDQFDAHQMNGRTLCSNVIKRSRKSEASWLACTKRCRAASLAYEALWHAHDAAGLEG
jgi:hypothetical protein